MTTFQFDQCFNDKKVIKACTEEGLVSALRLPRELWGRTDPDLLAVLMASPNPLVTLDRALPAEHVGHIPARHPGIVAVSFSREIPRTITTTEGSKVLRKFKQRVEHWHLIPLANSIIEITEKSVEVWHIDELGLVRDGYLEFNDAGDWAVQLSRWLNQNAERPSTFPPGQTDSAS